MTAAVRALAGDSGPLVSASGSRDSAGRYTSLRLNFRSGSLILACNDDTDEVVVTAENEPRGNRVLSQSALPELLGMSIDYAWVLTNHRGYDDAFQLRFVDENRREEVRQFE